MREWISFYVRPESKRAYWTYSLRELNDEIVSWCSSNQTKSTRIKLVQYPHGLGATSWSTVGDVHTYCYLQVKFRSKRDAVLFKMWFGDRIFNVGLADSVILPLIRRVMPNIIAHSILGVSPMTGPVGSIWSMRPRYSPVYSPKLAQQITKTATKKLLVMQQILKKAKLGK